MGVVAREQLPRPVREIEHLWVELARGTRLAARVWLPEDAERDPVPAVLEYLPYRKHDGTVARDAARQPYLAGHGYAAVRVDIHGTGESDGILEDEYTQRELDDAVEVIAWLAAQPWCSGAVGMTGISWGGFNALQVAALQPPALKAIMTLCSTDDRYADDVHYRGGCVLATDMLHWASSMLTWNARPPDPRLLPETWREIWLDRLERTPPYIGHWLAHQRRDAYWRHGSVCEDYAAIEVPVYAAGGWADGYTNAVFRLMAGLSGPAQGARRAVGARLSRRRAARAEHRLAPGVRPLVGPLAEGPRDRDHGRADAARVRARLGGAAAELRPPAGPLGRRGVVAVAADRAAHCPLAVSAPLARRPVQTLGTEAGVWCAEGQSADLAGDQSRDDALSACFDLEPLAEPLELLGFPAVELDLAADRPLALVCVRLCDIFPEGGSALVTRGLLNLAHRDGHEHPEPLEPGRTYRVRVELDSTGYAVPAGHRLRVAVSSTYWPWAWPSPEPVTLTLRGGALELPVRPPRAGDAALPAFAEPEHTPELETEREAASPDGRSLHRDYATGRLEQRFDYDAGGTVRFVELDLVSEDANSTVYSIVEDDPLSAEVTFRARTRIARGDWSGRAEVTASMRADAEAFHVRSELVAYERGEQVFARAWEHRFPRDHV